MNQLQLKLDPRPLEGGTGLPLVPGGVLESGFFDRAAENVALDLLGAQITRTTGGATVRALITEVAAYPGMNDLDTRAYRGPYRGAWEPGRMHVYSALGHAVMLFAVPPFNEGACVLIRAVEVLEGHQIIVDRRVTMKRGRDVQGPGLVARAFGVTTDNDGSIPVELGIIVTKYSSLKPGEILAAPRKSHKNDAPLNFSWRR